MLQKIIAFILVLIPLLSAQNYDKLANPNDLGVEITGNDTILISTLLENPDQYLGKKVIVKGMITDVCKKRGCWMKIASDEEFQDITIKVKDGEIVFPLEAKGKIAVAEGVFEAIDLSQEQAIKYYQNKAEEQGKEFDPKTITGPQKIYRIKGSGAQIEE